MTGMSLLADSQESSLNKSSSDDDFVAFLEAEPDAPSDSPSEEEDMEVEEGEEAKGEDDGDDTYNYDLQLNWVTKRNIEALEMSLQLYTSTSLDVKTQTTGTSSKEEVCAHPGVMDELCYLCGQKMDDKFGVSFKSKAC